MNVKFFLLHVLIATSIAASAQFDGNTKAKLYFQEAQRLFNQNQFGEAMEYLEKAENKLGATNGRILNLKIKSCFWRN